MVTKDPKQPHALPPPNTAKTIPSTAIAMVPKAAHGRKRGTNKPKAKHPSTIVAATYNHSGGAKLGCQPLQALATADTSKHTANANVTQAAEALTYCSP
jgi:hypothetical protein